MERKIQQSDRDVTKKWKEVFRKKEQPRKREVMVAQNCHLQEIGISFDSIKPTEKKTSRTTVER